MIVFSRKNTIQRMFKKRYFKLNKLPKLKFGTIGIYCLHTFRFEYRYCLFFRKFFKKLIKKRKRKIPTQYKRKTWLFIRPNYTLTHKSKNARMGKGKGNFKRWCTIVFPGKIFIEHINISYKTYLKYVLKMRIKLKLFLQIKTHSLNTIKNKQLKKINSYNSCLELIRVRKKLHNSF